ncbi:MAG: hypothetical protein ACFE8V_05795 [Promethearchaeota archaeon]
MPFFILDGIGFNCSHIKEACPKNVSSCYQCIKNRLCEMGFEIDSEFRIFEIESNEKHIKAERERIWQKFLDVLNIKHIIIMDKDSGLPILNYAVSGVDIDAGLLSGFIQANITFSESEEVSPNNLNSVEEHPFYEFQYKNFNILLRNGQYSRICLILDNTASNSMRNQVIKFLYEFEKNFKDPLVAFKETGAIDLEEMNDYIVRTFNANLVFPMNLAQSIPPYEIEKISRSPIQKAIFNLANELLLSKQIFFINKLIDKVKRIVNIEADIILYEINRLLERNIIVPIKLEAVIDKIETHIKANHRKENAIKPISSLINIESDFEQLKDEIDFKDEFSVKKLLKEVIRKAKIAEKDRAYQVAHKGYSKALYIAKELKLKDEINRITHLLFQLDYTTKKVELDFALEMAENYEKTKDFINSIHYYQKVIKILESFVIYNIADADSQLKKLRKKIIKLREEL